jgi:hypothetical protein
MVCSLSKSDRCGKNSTVNGAAAIHEQERGEFPDMPQKLVSEGHQRKYMTADKQPPT